MTEKNEGNRVSEMTRVLEKIAPDIGDIIGEVEFGSPKHLALSDCYQKLLISDNKSTGSELSVSDEVEMGILNQRIVVRSDTVPNYLNLLRGFEVAFLTLKQRHGLESNSPLLTLLGGNVNHIQSIGKES